MNFIGLSTPAYYGYLAGQAKERRDEFVQRAREADGSYMRCSLINTARSYHRDFMHALRRAKAIA